uniref:Uncharacterized protein n=2 Tax=Glossina morsitans morsitans TaxID=37546 RepID=A0ABK9MQX3_GLOMM
MTTENKDFNLFGQLCFGMHFSSYRSILGGLLSQSGAILSHVIPSTEVVKIYASTTSLESLSPLICSPLYTIVYNATLSYYPGVFNFFRAGLYLLCYTFIAIICDIEKLIGESTAYEHIRR